METKYRKSKSKLSKLLSVINFDYSWIFFNGIETAQEGSDFKRSLKQMYDESPSPSFVLKKDNKEF